MSANATVACSGCGQLNTLDLKQPLPPNCGKCRVPLPWITQAGDGDLADQLQQPIVTLVKFTSPGCAPCEQINPELMAVATQMTGQVRVMHYDASRNPAVTAAWNVTSVPVVFVVAGGPEPQVAQRFNGVVPAAVLLPAVQHALTLLPAQQGQN